MADGHQAVPMVDGPKEMAAVALMGIAAGLTVTVMVMVMEEDHMETADDLMEMVIVPMVMVTLEDLTETEEEGPKETVMAVDQVVDLNPLGDLGLMTKSKHLQPYTKVSVSLIII